MAERDMPTMRSRRLGNELRRLRMEAGLKVTDVAEILECGQPKISQIENGKRGIRQLDLTMLLNAFGVEDEGYRAGLKRLAREVHKVDWWTSEGPLLHDALRDFLTLEVDSDVLRTYEPTLIPGLLQTEGQMRAIFDTGHLAHRADALVEARLRRREILLNPTEFDLRVVIDLHAIQRLQGGRDLVVEQLEHLLREMERPNVTVQLLPYDAAVRPAQYVPFCLFTLRGEPASDVVWLEHLTGGSLLEQRKDVQVYARAWNELTAAAMTPSRSRQYLQDVIKETRT
ncbi:helix-turn-helix domain-containing protein [Streptomyces sp. NPDC087440]|uniref:helix-turn-helix domain-containing protein n=1 Tax=Streptomyces sp. NPDC087440 TaxID=3365790 RepID=UPI0038158DC0